jgi:hypothetical protein
MHASITYHLLQSNWHEVSTAASLSSHREGCTYLTNGFDMKLCILLQIRGFKPVAPLLKLGGSNRSPLEFKYSREMVSLNPYGRHDRLEVSPMPSSRRKVSITFMFSTENHSDDWKYMEPADMEALMYPLMVWCHERSERANHNSSAFEVPEARRPKQAENGASNLLRQ